MTVLKFVHTPANQAREQGYQSGIVTHPGKPPQLLNEWLYLATASLTSRILPL